MIYKTIIDIINKKLKGLPKIKRAFIIEKIQIKQDS